ncbi:Predicted N-acyltransferase, GNAT family [Dyella sp. OK004]|uniref:GNAT family N-acetyltransferase n=1 Tax=Dyella sp. OK004 TaxID=1855292 RepID=UPI0008DF2DF8|nr:GNAT family N-acetyltransferase [Dyella sp. OK004]SFS12913.1 Predicted N-acyltransferase, GNAT family [Dyella sp. OK004]
MNLQDFHLERADWTRERDREALREIRLEVFVHEQRVPEALEWDELDEPSSHVLARDASGQPIGCGRLTPLHKIGRMAVRQPWRGTGVGVALLRELVGRARALGWTEVSLDAQVTAIGFYEREGFVAHGEVFDDAGIPHRHMTLALAAAERPAQPVTESLPASNRSEQADTRLALLREARYRLMIYQPTLPSDMYSSAAELDQLRRIATSGRGAEIRVLLHDPAAALRDSHRLVALAQRLPSGVLVRTPLEELDLAYGSAYLLTDSGGYLFQPDAGRPQGRASAHDRAGQAPLQQHFNEVWERAERATALQPLDI